MIRNLYVNVASPIHSLNFWTKLLAFLLLLPLAAFVVKPALLPVLFVALIWLVIKARVGPYAFFKLVRLYAIPLALGVLVLSLIAGQGSSETRLITGAILAMRFALLFSFGTLFSVVTNPIEIPMGFLQMRLPHRYGITLMVGLRMLPLLAQKIQTVVDAQKCRGANFRLSARNLNGFMRRVASLFVPVLHFTLETSVQLSDTLISRGYNPYGQITRPPIRWQSTDALLLALCLALLISAII